MSEGSAQGPDPSAVASPLSAVTEGDRLESASAPVGSTGGLPAETTAADALEQRSEVVDDAGVALVPQPMPDSAEPADVLEQAQPVRADEDDYR